MFALYVAEYSFDGKNPWRRAWQSTPVFLPGEFHWLRSLVGYGPQGSKESEVTYHARIHDDITFSPGEWELTQG